MAMSKLEMLTPHNSLALFDDKRLAKLLGQRLSY
jgi:hypothetical protein